MILGAVWYAVDGTLKTQARPDLLPSRSLEINGMNEKLKNYTQLKSENGVKQIPIVTLHAHANRQES